jgi:hypothetical protein
MEFKEVSYETQEKGGALNRYRKDVKTKKFYIVNICPPYPIQNDNLSSTTP